MTQQKRPGFTHGQLAIVLIVAGLLAEMSPGFSRDFPGGGWSFLTAGCAALAAGIVRKRSARAARVVLIVGFFAAGAALMRGCADASRARPAPPAARTP